MIPEIVIGGPIFGYRDAVQLALFSIIKYNIGIARYHTAG